MKNNSHNESLGKRTTRFKDNPPAEIIDTLLNSIDNFFNNEIRLTVKDNHYQTSLLFLGIHSVALTISEGFFDKKGSEGYKLFLEKFVDGKTKDTRFSEIAKTIHNWRNNIAHQWLSSSGHSIGYDYKMKKGWEKRENIIFINPKIYCEQYLRAFSSNSSIWKLQSTFTETELEKIKASLLNKFKNN